MSHFYSFVLGRNVLYLKASERSSEQNPRKAEGSNSDFQWLGFAAPQAFFLLLLISGSAWSSTFYSIFSSTLDFTFREALSWDGQSMFLGRRPFSKDQTKFVLWRAMLWNARSVKTNESRKNPFDRRGRGTSEQYFPKNEPQRALLRDRSSKNILQRLVFKDRSFFRCIALNRQKERIRRRSC